MSDLYKLLQGKTIYDIYMTFLITRSGYFVGAPPRVHNTRDTSGASARSYKSLRFKTYSHPEFKFYYNLFYPAKRLQRDPEGREAHGLRRQKRIP